MFRIFILACLFSSVCGSLSHADDRTFERTTLCRGIVARYGQLQQELSDADQYAQCFENLAFIDDPMGNAVTLMVAPNFIFCQVTAAPSKMGIKLGECSVTQRKPRMGVSN